MGPQQAPDQQAPDQHAPARQAPAAALFEAPADRLGKRTHDALCAGLPAGLAQALDTAPVAAAVRALLDRGWRVPQLAARIGALPDPGGPSDAWVSAVVAFLRALLDRDSPVQAADRARLERDQESAQRAAGHERSATDRQRDHWVAEARRSLGLPPRRQRPAGEPAVRRCACCAGDGEFFVTREVRLCGACVELLGSGRARLAVGA